MLHKIKKCAAILMAAAMITTITSAAFPMSAAALEKTDDETVTLASSTKLAAPTEVAWGKFADESGNLTDKTVPGIMTWKVNKSSEYVYNIKLYNADNNEEIWQHTGYGIGTDSGYVSYSDILAGGGSSIDSDTAVPEFELESGRYYFTVQSQDPNEKYESSDAIKSDIWEYKKPDKALEAPTDLYWDGNELHWTAPSDTSLVYSYAIDYYWLDESTGEYKLATYKRYSDMLNDWDRKDEHPSRTISGYSKYGEGKYVAAVKALSMNMEEACSSPWSVLSSEHEYREGVKPLSLYDIIQKYNDDETLSDEQNAEMKKYVAAIGTENLRAAILADDDYRGKQYGNIGTLSDLEKKAGGTATIDVLAAPKWLTSLGTDGISVIGANLNSETGNAKLSIGQADESSVVPNLYKNAVKFSMTLDNAGDSSDIKIPVEIILPITDIIDTSSLAVLHFKNDGSCEEIQRPRVFTENGKKYVSIIVTSFSDFAIAEKSSDGLPKLATPTDLVWGKCVDEKGNLIVEDDIPGLMSWKCSEPNQYVYILKLYNADNDTEVFSQTIHDGNIESSYEAMSVLDAAILAGEDWINERSGDNTFNIDSGRYYFTVQMKGDGKNYDSSDIARSEVWEYKKPSRKLNAPDELHWKNNANDIRCCWSATSDQDLIYGYSVQFYYLDESTGEYKFVESSTAIYPLDDDERYSGTGEDSFSSYSLQKYGEGKYYFTVRTLSMNIEEACSSEWSEFSPVYYFENVKLNLDDLMQKYESETTLTDEQKKELKQSVAANGTEKLKKAMLMDDDHWGYDSGTMSKLRALEEKTGHLAYINNNNAPDWLDTSNIMIIGANLNSETGNAELSIGPADEGTVPPALYKNALKFSMTLDNADDPEELKIPVRIILPVPDDMDPAFLVMLHFHKDGTYEEVPGTRVFTEDGKKYISIVLTSFSDFAVAERSFDNNFCGY